MCKAAICMCPKIKCQFVIFKGASTVSNEYDNEIFFEEYAKMPRSKGGLSSAGEWCQFGSALYRK